MGRLKTLDEWLDYQLSLHATEIHLGLERVQNVCQNLFPNGVPFKVITVAGTNGKGSTCAFIESIYQQSNVKTGKFSSPHIVKYNERFNVDGTHVDDAQICTAFEQIERARGVISLTYFEFSALAALLIFAQADVEIAILEVGLGGRLDAVNMIDADVCVITNIAIDHTDYLGDTREAIGFEKAGIMRTHRPCLCSDDNPPQSLINHSEKIAAKLEFVTAPYLGEIGLLGAHQQQNAALAIKAVLTLENIFPLSQANIEAGIKNTTIEGRLQIKTLNGKTVVLDVAHNPAAVQVLADELAREPQPTLAIFSVMNDKNITSMIELMRPQVDKWLVLPLDNERAISVKDLSNLFALSDNIQACKTMPKALELTRSDAAHSRIVVFGSFHIVADAIKAIDRFN